MRRQPDPDVGDQGRATGGALLHDVEHVPAVQDGQVRAVADGVDERREMTAGDPLQRLLPRVAAADLERRDAEAVAVLVGEVDDEAFLDHRVDQVVGRRPRDADGTREAVERDGVGLAGQEPQHPERAGRRRHLTHGADPRAPDSGVFYMCPRPAADTRGCDPTHEPDCSTDRRSSLLLSCLLVLTGLGVNMNSPAAAALPSKSQWVSDTYKAMEGSRAYTERRVASGDKKLAINFDIDNTSLASHYDYGKAVAVTLRFAKHAKAHGVSVLVQHRPRARRRPAAEGLRTC